MENKKEIQQIKPGMFGKVVAADNRRAEFDFKNEQILYLGTQIDYLFLGDSITHQWDLYAYFKQGKQLENRGISGDSSEYLLKRFDADCIQLHPKFAIIMIGTNDIFRIEPDLWWRTPGEDMEVVLADYQNNILMMLDKCEQAGIEVILCSVLPSNVPVPFQKEARWEMTRRMNEFLKSTGKTYVDYFSRLAEADTFLPDDLTPDGVHPNAKAYEIMAETLKETINI